MQALTGRTVIYSDFEEVNQENIIKVIEAGMKIHSKNSKEISFLYDYYKGKQPILERVKKIRPDINNKIVENRANEIVAFKSGYLIGEPIQYVCRDGASEYFELVNLLNAYSMSEDKATKDKELVDWFHICGTAYRLILPDGLSEEDEAPFEIYTLDPRNTFIVYSSGIGNKPLCAVNYVKQKDNKIVYSAYTANAFYKICEGKILESQAHSIGEVPIVEYPANNERQGAFEVVLPLLDALNKISSNRADGVEQFIQALLMLKNVDMTSADFANLLEQGGIKVPADGDVKYLVQELNQTQTQTLVDYYYQTILTICGMPNRNGGNSTSDTGSAVIMRDGWQMAEARAKATELMFTKSERQFLKLAIYIMNTLRNTDLKLSNIKIKFTRRNYENILEKTQVLSTLLGTGEVNPKYAFELCGLFSEPDLACAESMEYKEQAEQKIFNQVINEEDGQDEANNTDR